RGSVACLLISMGQVQSRMLFTGIHGFSQAGANRQVVPGSHREADFRDGQILEGSDEIVLAVHAARIDGPWAQLGPPLTGFDHAPHPRPAQPPQDCRGGADSNEPGDNAAHNLDALPRSLATFEAIHESAMRRAARERRGLYSAKPQFFRNQVL